LPVPREEVNADFRFTDHPHELILPDGLTYQPLRLDPSARGRRAGFEPGDVEVIAVIDDDRMTDQLLRSGALLDAEVTEYTVDWLMPYLPPVETIQYHIRELEYDGDRWLAKCGTICTVLEEQVGDYYGPLCPVELFSTGLGQCNADPTDHTASFVVRAVIEPFSHFSISGGTITGSWELPVVFAGGDKRRMRDGKIVWTSGDNVGHVSYIKDAPEDDEAILHLPTPNPMQVGDVATIQTGCNKLIGTGQSGNDPEKGDCRNFYLNDLNFQGDPYMPTRDETTRGIQLT